MNRKNSIHCINRHLYNVLLSELRTLETKCNRITAEVSEVKKMIALLPPDIGTLISSIERSEGNARTKYHAPEICGKVH